MAELSPEPQRTVVTDVRIPFGSLVVLMVKWALAAIPAFLILALIGAALSGALAGVFLSMRSLSVDSSGSRHSHTEAELLNCRKACDELGRGAECYANCEQMN
jgi:hypothetical protein